MKSFRYKHSGQIWSRKTGRQTVQQFATQHQYGLDAKDDALKDVEGAETLFSGEKTNEVYNEMCFENSGRRSFQFWDRVLYFNETA